MGSELVAQKQSASQHLKMFLFASSRPKFKFRPPKILLYYSLCLITIFIVLLIAQLRATEVSSRPQPHFSSQTTTTTTTKSPRSRSSHPDHTFNLTPEILNEVQVGHDNNSTTSGSNHEWDNRVESAPAQATTLPPPPTIVSSIDRDDRTSTYDDSPSDALRPLANQTQRVEPAEDLVVSPSAPGNLQAALESNTRDQQQHTATGEARQPSLAELTAAGAAAGLLVHDMLAQANVVNPFPYDELTSSLGAAAQQHTGAADDEASAQMAYAQIDPREQMQELLAIQQQQLLDEGRQYPVQDEQLRQMAPQRSMGSAPVQTRQVSRAVSTEPEPPNEDQMPDSIESLMGADGAAEADGDDGSSSPSSASDPGADQQQRAQESTGADESEDGEQTGGLVPQQAVHQQQIVAAALNKNDEDDNDEDDDNDNAGVQQPSVAALQPAGSNLYGRNDASTQPRLSYDQSIDSFQDPEMMASEFGITGDEQEQSLVAPMRDSLSDLNAAAGHYYGKKKKKKKVKKKKIVIKKKKKKKIKYKKVKIIKIKKKGTKKKVKKYHKGKKHHHGHGHRKYYM